MAEKGMELARVLGRAKRRVEGRLSLSLYRFVGRDCSSERPSKQAKEKHSTSVPVALGSGLEGLFAPQDARGPDISLDELVCCSQLAVSASALCEFGAEKRERKKDIDRPRGWGLRQQTHFF